VSEITQLQVERAINYLAQTDDIYGELVGRCKALEYRIKVARSQAFLDATGTIAERDSIAQTSQEYKDKIDEYENAVMEKEIIAAKRKRAELTCDVWRSINAARRQG